MPPFSLKHVAIVCCLYTLAVHFPTFPVAFVGTAFRCCPDSIPVRTIVPVLALVHKTIWRHRPALTLHKAVHPGALVAGAIPQVLHATPGVTLAFFECSLPHLACGAGHLALTMLFVVEPFSFVLSTIWMRQNAIALSLSIDDSSFEVAADFVVTSSGDSFVAMEATSTYKNETLLFEIKFSGSVCLPMN